MRLASIALSTCLPSLWASLALVAWLAAPQYARGERAAEAIHFARGASSAEVRGAVVRGERALYTLEARAGQRLTLHIVALENNAVFQVYALGARPETRDYGLDIVAQALAGAGEGDDATRWTGALPRS
jgi:hypothetical protein